MSKRLLAAFFSLAMAVPAVHADSAGDTTSGVPLAALGGLSLDYARASGERTYPGQAISAQVTFRKGEAFTLVAPRRVRQIEYLVEVGDHLAKGQPLAVMRGPEMHHFLYEFEAGKELLATAKRRYQSNKPLYERKAIRESQWLEVSQNYYAAQLEYEHSRHFYDLVVETNEAQDSITITAPMAGIVAYSPGYSGLEAGDDIAVFVPEKAVRLEVSVPSRARKDLVSVATSNCSLGVTSVSGVTDGFLVSGWTEPLKPQCDEILGQQLLVIPHYRTEAVRVPGAALFQWREENYILVLAGDKLVPEKVDLIAATGADYLVKGNSPLDGRDILVSSVSAVQGILLGLGGE